jgi:hypothetical protein
MVPTMRLAVMSVVLSVFLFGCTRHDEPRLFVDPNGFVLNSSDQMPTVRVGVGMPASELLQKNPVLRGSAWVPKPGDPFDQFRLVLSTPLRLNYDDGQLKFKVCADSAAIDGNDDLKVGVAVVGFLMCNPPVDRINLAIAQAEQLLAIMKTNSASVVDLSETYRTASQESLTSIGGRQWSGIAQSAFSNWPAPRDNVERMEHLKTLEQARTFFSGHKVNGIAKRNTDGNVINANALVGVYGTDQVIIEVGISSSATFGGTKLTKEQENSITYRVGMNIRIRPQAKARVTGA